MPAEAKVAKAARAAKAAEAARAAKAAKAAEAAKAAKPAKGAKAVRVPAETEEEGAASSIARSLQEFTATPSKNHGNLGTFHGNQILYHCHIHSPYFWLHFLPLL
jgi:hypothetical protein